MKSEHLEHAGYYIGHAANLAHDDPTVCTGLAQANAILVLADAVADLAKAVRQVGNIPEPVDPAFLPVPPGWSASDS
ncbi:MAG: hypothetical protein FWE35_00810 [Streptosporangiales bacterium]|jgi:hypothetical protein|nr:hypothetical protein [Streptosporangiales bacterium]